MKVPSQAELGHINFLFETELSIPTIGISKNSNFVPVSSLGYALYEFI